MKLSKKNIFNKKIGTVLLMYAAEIVLRKDIINETKYLSNLVKQLAADAYRQYVLTGF